MSDELKPVRCGCGGEAEIVKRFSPDYDLDVFYAKCKNCGIETDDYFLEDEAIVAWNIAMGERTAKVSNQIFNNSNPYTVGAWIGTCECGELVSYSSKYCHMCGAKLDWSENERPD